MSFSWINNGGQLALEHTTASGETIIVKADDADDYVKNLHASERQTPVPDRPIDVPDSIDEDVSQQNILHFGGALANQKSGLDLANDQGIQDAAREKPEAIVAAVTDALSRAHAALAACHSAVATLEAIAKSLDI